MSPGGYPSHLASLKTAPAPAPPAGDPPPLCSEPIPDHQRLFATGAEVVLAHRDKITAGVPGCTCGKSYPDDSHGYYALLHARHVSDQLITCVLAAVVAAIREDLDEYARDPERWNAGQHDSAAAIDAIIKMADRESELARQKETTAR
jgi:hypothetical protein